MKKAYVLAGLAMLLFLIAVPVVAQGTEGASGGNVNWVALTSGFAMAIASAGCAIAQARATAAAAEGMARNPGAAPSIRFALILALVLIESLALYTLVIILMKVQ